ESDFIYASFGEEIGMAGLFVILLCYLFIFQRGIRTAQQLRDGFGTLLATGLSFTIALQVFVVVGGVTRLIPLTGLTTPCLAQRGVPTPRTQTYRGPGALGSARTSGAHPYCGHERRGGADHDSRPRR